MTSTVIVKAHCADTKEVKVRVTDKENLIEEVTLQNGAEFDGVIYDDRTITAIEVEK